MCQAQKHVYVTGLSGQGKVREFLFWSGNVKLLLKVKSGRSQEILKKNSAHNILAFDLMSGLRLI